MLLHTLQQTTYSTAAYGELDVSPPQVSKAHYTYVLLLAIRSGYLLYPVQNVLIQIKRLLKADHCCLTSRLTIELQ